MNANKENRIPRTIRIPFERMGAWGVALVLVLALTGASYAQSPVEVEAAAFIDPAQAGGVGEVTCGVFNTTSATSVDVLLFGTLTYSDGRKDRIIGPVRQTLGPGFGFEITPLFLIPADTALGPATFECDVRVTRISGDTGHTDYPSPLLETATAAFTVVP